MPRPKRMKKVGCAYEGCVFGLRNTQIEDVITLESDAYEAFRLIDYLGLNQLEASKKMEVARTTVQALYKEARTKIALAMFESKMLHIIGGPHIMREESCCQQNDLMVTKVAVMLKDGKIASTYHDANALMLYTINNQDVERKDLITPQLEQRMICKRFLMSLGVEHVISGAMYHHIYQKFQASQIKVYYAQDSFDEAIKAWLLNTVPSMHTYTVDQEHHQCCGHHHDEKHGCCKE